MRRPPSPTLSPDTTLFRSGARRVVLLVADVSHVDAAELRVVLRRSRESPVAGGGEQARHRQTRPVEADRKSTRLNSSHSQISYAVFCLKKKKMTRDTVAKY